MIMGVQLPPLLIKRSWPMARRAQLMSAFCSGLIGNAMKHMITALCLTLFVGLQAQSVQARNTVLPTMLTMYEGQSKVVNAPNAVRISVGKADLISSTLLKNGEVVLIADSKGETNLQVWFEDGHREEVPVVIVEGDGWRQAVEVKALLGDIPGIKVTTVGRRVVVDGNLEARDLERVKLVKERYDDMLVLAREITDYEQKMIYFDVRITEFDRDETEELGINWSKSFAGPSLGYAKNWKPSANDGVDLSGVGPVFGGNSTQGSFDNWDTALSSGSVYWGIATEITSLIDVLEQTGAAIVLAEPRLSARSGGTADLTVGGEIPVVTSSLNGSSVEYKDYGILLGIQPNLDLYNNITARVSVSISQLDLANAVADQPAFKKRSTENDVNLKPGETLVLSGLITREEQVTHNKVKWLSDIPVLGELFKSKSFTSGVTEMVIFITPRLMGDLSGGINRSELDRAARMQTDYEDAVGHGLME